MILIARFAAARKSLTPNPTLWWWLGAVVIAVVRGGWGDDDTEAHSPGS